MPAQRRTRAQVSRTVGVPAPVGGWNARDSLADMDKRDAVILDNFFCTPTDVRVRDGYVDWATGLGAQVSTLASYSPPSGSAELFAAAGGNIYDVTASGAVGAAVVTGKTSAEWQHAMMGTSGGQFLLMCNGADDVLSYDGTTWSNPSITGVTPANLIHINVHKNRVWFIEKNTLKAWYLGTNAVAGAASPFDFSGLFTRGGYLVAMATWSLDVGFGMDDYAVWVTSEGQVAVYQGTDPASASTWSLVGVYQLGEPLGRRCFIKFGGDVLYLGADGLTPLSKALVSTTETTNQRVTAKIQSVVSEYVTQYGSNFGWQCAMLPSENMLLVNVPTAASGPQSMQLAMNTISGAWSRFTGISAACWERHNEQLYFGGNGVVCRAWGTRSDNGANINFEALQAFNPHGNNSQLKQVKMLRPVFSTDGAPAVRLGVNADYDTSAPTGALTYTPVSGAQWGVARWGIDVWGGGLTIKRDWQSGFAMGYAFAAHMIGTVRAERFRWAATDYVIEDAGVL